MFLANEATDACTMEQILICVCFVDRKDEDSTLEVREEFLGFVEAESTKAAVLAEKFMTTQAEFRIETHKMCARLRRCCKYGRRTQGCASNHKIVCTGSSVRPLKSQSLNLAIGNTLKEPLVRNNYAQHFVNKDIHILLFSQATASQLSRIFTPRCFSKRGDENVQS